MHGNEVLDTVELLSYWDTYYKKNRLSQTSDFAKEVLRYMAPGERLLDMGCGNGGDSLFYSRNGLQVTAVDLSGNALKNFCHEKAGLPIVIRQENFVDGWTVAHDVFDIYYSRWTMHSITAKQQTLILDNISRQAESGARFCVEARSINDTLFGQGECVERDTYVFQNHFRRFLRKDEFLSELVERGFKVISAKEGQGFSVYRGSNPVLLRVVAEKR